MAGEESRTTRSFGALMAECADAAVENAKNNGIELDYTPASIERVETLLEGFHAELPRDAAGGVLGSSAEDAVTIARIYGGYVGEVLRRSAGGEWVVDKGSPTIGPDSAISLRKGNARIFPADKVMKRLINGSVDNVSFYYQMVVKRWA